VDPTTRRGLRGRWRGFRPTQKERSALKLPPASPCPRLSCPPTATPLSNRRGAQVVTFHSKLSVQGTLFMSFTTLACIRRARHAFVRNRTISVSNSNHDACTGRKRLNISDASIREAAREVQPKHCACGTTYASDFINRECPRYLLLNINRDNWETTIPAQQEHPLP